MLDGEIAGAVFHFESRAGLVANLLGRVIRDLFGGSSEGVPVLCEERFRTVEQDSREIASPQVRDFHFGGVELRSDDEPDGRAEGDQGERREEHFAEIPLPPAGRMILLLHTSIERKSHTPASDRKMTSAKPVAPLTV